ncbi:MAG: hypothetical protein HND55_02410 [Pseudomonadota bacterium]|nr:MAG: hypothetical protein HND55_02410 [Pseudomonadota bacterium]
MSSETAIRSGLAAMLIVLLAGCTGPSNSNQEAATPPVEEASMSDDADTFSLEQAVEAARNELSERSGVDPEKIDVIEARPVTWANGALGCPEEGMMYTQALVEGYFIRLRAGGQAWHYHAGSDGQPFLCPAKRSQAPAGNPAQDFS